MLPPGHYPKARQPDWDAATCSPWLSLLTTHISLSEAVSGYGCTTCQHRNLSRSGIQNRGLICDVAFSLNRKWLSTHNLDGVVKVWDISAGRMRNTLRTRGQDFKYRFFRRIAKDSPSLTCVVRESKSGIRKPVNCAQNSPVKLKRTAILVSPFHLILVSSQRRKVWTEIAMLNASKSGTSHAGNKLHTSLDTQTACAESPFHRAVGFWHQAARRMEQCEPGRLKTDS